MELPQDIINHVKTFLPPHPLQNQISQWNESNLFHSRKQYFHKWYFSRIPMQKSKDKIKRFMNDNDFWIKMSNLPNEEAVKLKHKCYLDGKRMNEKLKQMNIKKCQCKTITHIPRLNKHGNFSEVFFNGQEIIY